MTGFESIKEAFVKFFTELSFPWNTLTISLTTILTLILLSTLFILAVALIRELALKDIFFTLVKEGTAKAIMGVGGSGFQRMIMQFSGKRINANGNIDNKGKKDPWLKKKLGLSGIKILGIPFLHTIHTYDFRWNSLKQAADKKTTDKGGIYFKPHDEPLKYIILQSDVYYARVEGAEDEKMVPLDVDLTLELQIKNPYKALFVAQEWLEMTWGIILPAVRRYISENEWQILAGKTKEKEEDFKNSMGSVIKKLEKDFGIVLVEFRMLRIKPGGARATMYEEAATAEYKADQEAKAVLIAAKVEKKRIRTVFGEVEKYKELGLAIYQLEALVNSSKGPGNMIISAPELSNMSAALGALMTKPK